MFAKLKALREERENGFTLIELLVVILIIGILAAIAIPVFLNQRKTAVDAGTISDVKNSGDLLGGKQGGEVTMADLREEMPTFSQGTVIALSGSYDEGYCVQGYNPDGNHDSTAPVAYDSLKGGMLKEGQQTLACPGNVLTTPIDGGVIPNPDGDSEVPDGGVIANPPTDPNRVGGPDGSDPYYWQVSAGGQIYQEGVNEETGETGIYYPFTVYSHANHTNGINGTIEYKIAFADTSLNSNSPIIFQFYNNGTFEDRSVTIVDGKADFGTFDNSSYSYYGPITEGPDAYDQQNLWN